MKLGYRKGNNYTEKGDIIEVHLNYKYKAIIDKEDLHKILGHTWRFCYGYAVTCVPNGKHQKTIGMHRFILGTPAKGLVTDHINHDKLDNRKVNLRHCTQKENMQNTTVTNPTGVHGVYYRPELDKWMARFFRNGKYLLNQVYDTKEKAIAARLIAERAYEAKT